MGIVEFLRARLDEDEAQAQRSKADNAMNPNLRIPAGWVNGVADRVLREVKAKQAVMAEHRPHDHRGEHGDAIFCDACQWDHGDDSPRIDNQPTEGFGQNPCRTLVALASVYADHPDCDPDWLT